MFCCTTTFARLAASTAVLLALAALMPTRAEAVVLLSHWRFDEITGSTTPDQTGTSPGSINGSISVSPNGKIGNALSFDAKTAATFVGVFDHAQGANALTASFWMLPTGTESQGALGHWDAGAGNATILIRTDANGSLQTFARHPSGSQIGGTVAFSGSVSASDYNHVAITYDGQRVRTYLNGEESSTVHSFGAPTALGQGTATTLAIGGRGSSESTYLGLIDDVSFFNSQLSASQIKVLKNIADRPELNYDAGYFHDLLGVFSGAQPSIMIDDLIWTQASGLGGAAGDVFQVGAGAFFINFDGVNGLLGTPPIIPEPSSALLLMLGTAALAARRPRRRLAS